MRCDHRAKLAKVLEGGMSGKVPSPDQDLTDHLRQLLVWYAAMGADAVVDAAPHDRFSESAQPGRPHPPPQPNPPPPVEVEAPRPKALPPADVAARSAEAIASAAPSLAALQDALDTFDGCGLKATATQLVFGDGDPAARLMFVGEAPGADEDRQGLPFVGRAGQLLNRMLAAIGLERQAVYIANVVPWRPPGNRTPTPAETAACLPFCLRQIALVNPDVVVCLGGSSAQAVLGAREGITKMRGRWQDLDIGGGDRPVRRIHAMATLHPAYLLRQPAHKRMAWRDFREIAKRLASGA
jgi:uracil-DNA glycosylase family 4